MRTRISIVVPSLNQGEFIEQTLRSLAAQRGLPPGALEVIVIDGGSTDGTLDVLEKYRHFLSLVVSEPDNGQTDALIKGFSVSRGDILGWLCADDMLLPDALAEVLAFFDQHPGAQFIYGDAIWVDRHGRWIRVKKEIPFRWFLWLYCYNYIPQPAAFWRRSLYESVGGLDPAFALAMDGDLWARFAERTTPIHVPEIWALMRRYPEQKNQRLRILSDLEDERIRRRYGVDPSRVLSYWARRIVARLWRVCWRAARGGYWSTPLFLALDRRRLQADSYQGFSVSARENCT